MSIETQLEELNQIKTNIFTSITNKGVIVPENPGLKDAAGLIDQIESGGGGEIPDSYKQVMYIEFNGRSNPRSNTLFYSQTYTDKIYSIDTIEIDFFLPNSQWVIDSSLWLFDYTGSWSDARGYTIVSQSELNTRFQNYRELNKTEMDNLGKFISYKKSARLIKSGDVVPSGYEHVGQITINGVLQELNQYGDLQSINNYDLRGLYLFSASNSPFGQGAKIFKIKFKEFETERVKGNFIPCIRNSDSQPGFYEPNLDVFLTPYNSDSWTAGPIIS